jgi:hypothetical protein
MVGEKISQRQVKEVRNKRRSVRIQRWQYRLIVTVDIDLVASERIFRKPCIVKVQ